MDNVKYLFVPESNIPDYLMVGSISRMRNDKMLKYVPERTCKPDFRGSYFGICDCGYGIYFDMNYCSHCGAKVVE